MGWPTLSETGSTERRARRSAMITSLLRPPSFRSTSISEECTPSACSSSSARPVRRPTAFTSGTSSMSFSAMRPTRFDSASEMPGLNSMLMVKVPSLKGGRNARGSSAAPPAAATTATAGERQQQLLAREGALQQRPVGALERAHEPAFALLEPLQARQHVVGHHRGERDGDHEAGQDGDDVGLAERREQTAFDAGERKQRHEHQHDDERGVDDARAHLVGGGDHDIEDGARVALLAVLAQAAEDVLDIDDGIVDELADGDREAAERHGVDGQPHQMKDDGGRQDRDREWR